MEKPRSYIDAALWVALGFLSIYVLFAHTLSHVLRGEGVAHGEETQTSKSSYAQG